MLNMKYNQIAKWAAAAVITLFAVSQGSAQTITLGEAFPVRDLSLSSDYQTIIAPQGSDVVLFRMGFNDKRALTGGHKTVVTAVDIYDKTAMAVSGDGDGNIVLWDLTGATQRWKINAGVTFVNDLIFTFTGMEVIAALADGRIIIYSTTDGQLIRELQLGYGAINSLASCSAGFIFASAHDDGSVSVWSLENWSEKQRFSNHKKPATTVTFSDDGTVMASAGADGRAVIYNVEFFEAFFKREYKYNIKMLSAFAVYADNITMAAAGSGPNYTISYRSAHYPQKMKTQVYAIKIVPLGANSFRLAMATEGGLIVVDSSSMKLEYSD
jgi:WD40 repeat protein